MVRFIKPDQSDIIPCLDGVNDISGIAKRMIAALEKEKREVPEELRALAE